MAPEVLAAMPAADEAPLAARDIHARMPFGAPLTVKHVLNMFLRDGIAEGHPSARRAGACATFVYRRAAAR